MKVLRKTVNPHFKRDINKLMVRSNIFAEKLMNLSGEKFAEKTWYDDKIVFSKT